MTTITIKILILIPTMTTKILMPQIKTIRTITKSGQIIITISNSIKEEGYKVTDHNKRVTLFLLSKVQLASVQ